MISSAESFPHSYSQEVDCLLVRARHVTPPEMKSFEYARRPEILHSSIQDLAPQLVPLGLIFLVRCHCKDFRFAQSFREYDGVSCRDGKTKILKNRNKPVKPIFRHGCFVGTALRSKPAKYIIPGLPRHYHIPHTVLCL
jgi:hypothetical protein